MKASFLFIHMVAAITINVCTAAAQWSAASQTPVCSQDRQTQLRPEVCAGASFSTVFSWADYRNTINPFTDIRIDVYAQKLDSAGVAKWAFNGIRISADTLFTQSFKTAGSNGQYFFIMQKGNNTNNTDSIRFHNYLQQADDNGNVLWGTAGKRLISITPSWQNQAELIPHLQGGIICAWTDNRFHQLAPLPFPRTGNLFLQRFSADGLLLWAANGVAANANTATRVQSHYQLASDGVNGVFAVYAESDTGFMADADIFVQRLNGNGNPQLANGINITQAAKMQLPIAVAAGKQNDCLLLYGESSNIIPSVDVWLRAQRLDSAGNRLWGAAGIYPFSTDSVYKMDGATACSDASGGLIVMAYTTTGNLLVQRISATGAKLWGPSGLTVFTPADTVGAVRIRADDNGGAVLVFNRNNNITGADVYATRINAAGIKKGAIAGMPVCIQRAGQSNPVFWLHDSTRIVAGWEDQRNEIIVIIGGIQVSIGNDDDIYATRFTTAAIDSYIATPVLALSREPGNTVAVFPNPATGPVQLRFSLAQPQKNIRAVLYHAGGAFAGTVFEKSFLPAGVHQFQAALPVLQPGIYLLAVYADNKQTGAVKLIVR